MFTQIDGQSHNYLGRVTGTGALDTTFNNAGVTNNPETAPPNYPGVYCLAVAPNVSSTRCCFSVRLTPLWLTMASRSSARCWTKSGSRSCATKRATRRLAQSQGRALLFRGQGNRLRLGGVRLLPAAEKAPRPQGQRLLFGRQVAAQEVTGEFNGAELMPLLAALPG